MIRVTVENESGRVEFWLDQLSSPWMGKTVDGYVLAVEGREENGPLDDVLNLAQDRWGLQA